LPCGGKREKPKRKERDNHGEEERRASPSCDVQKKVFPESRRGRRNTVTPKKEGEGKPRFKGGGRFLLPFGGSRGVKKNLLLEDREKKKKRGVDRFAVGQKKGEGVLTDPIKGGTKTLVLKSGT